MWYVKNEFQDKVFFKHKDVRVTQDYVSSYNRNFKFSSQRYFKFSIYDFTKPVFIVIDKIDVNYFMIVYKIFADCRYVHPFAVKDFHNKHLNYRKKKFNLICKLAKKYHVWSFNEYGRKCDSFDF